MARKPNTTIELADDIAIGSGLSAAQHLAAEHNLQVVRQFGDGQPYERERVINEVRFFLGTAAEAMLEAGKRLVELKEFEGHGAFVSICEERLGLSPRTAQQMMQAAIKYLSPALEKHAAQLQGLGKAKLIELLAEDDEDLAALAEGGTVAGLELDEVERMSCRELRKALRDAREDKTAQGRVMADKDAKINELSTQLAKKPVVEVKPLDEQLKELRLEATAKAGAAEAAISGALYPAIHLLMQHEGADQRVFAAGLLAQVEQALLEIRAEYGIDAAPVASTAPRWMQDGAEDEVAAALAAEQGA
ncbi:DUF3102 domain-containing protein [Ectopseudomonas oleovorans]|uniref:DUF3102 domain-containing protein n=1 Tax=Ectopseudomonas oleovorans TaxID=301 RepID=A0AA42QES9_ECTOL|nr:DUF3102 domain-containing protein [Pseudomonas oleovorans]MDH1339803.1 DUF3102 domain-containing protein [Pseudomonas oleovorans]MDH1492653.1 DUF3102 domain-containing protein [Pseudomonas oleovorans]WGG21676.1 DUF3102 domain-containing protein [Pseudomonas oleovorans]